MHSQPISYVLLAGLAIALLLAAFTDLRRRQIDNGLNAAIALAAPLFWWASGLGWPAIGLQLALAAGSFALLGALFALRVMGGGDVKLLTALALWFRPGGFARMIVMMALLGGVLTLVVAAGQLIIRQPARVTVPYGVAIAAAGLWLLTGDYLPAR